jgi:hypothetical protein
VLCYREFAVHHFLTFATLCDTVYHADISTLEVKNVTDAVCQDSLVSQTVFTFIRCKNRLWHAY